jgi:hypothetical protein
MSDQDRLRRLASFLYGLTALMLAGTMIELLAAKHFQEPIQFVPFLLCLAGLGVVLFAWRRPRPETVQALRAVMLVTAGGSLLGVWKHIEGNIGFIHEMHPDTAGPSLILGAVTGRAPLLASGALAATAAVAIAATFAAGWGLRAVAPERDATAPAGRMAPSLPVR